MPSSSPDQKHRTPTYPGTTTTTNAQQYITAAHLPKPSQDHLISFSKEKNVDASRDQAATTATHDRRRSIRPAATRIPLHRSPVAAAHPKLLPRAVVD